MNERPLLAQGGCGVVTNILAKRQAWAAPSTYPVSANHKSDKGLLDKAGVPEAERRALTKAEIALELLDSVRAEGLPGRAVVADAGYGVSEGFRDGLQARGLSYAVGVTGELVVFTREPCWEMPGPPGRRRGRPGTRPRLAGGSPQPIALSELAKQVKLRRVTWRE